VLFAFSIESCRKIFSSRSFLLSSASTSNPVVRPDILRVLISYLKYHHIHQVAYIYDYNQAKHHVYHLLQYINNDEYFNNFSLEIRATHDDDIYSLLYNIESNSLGKDYASRYILLDLYSFDSYQYMFEKISHMGT
jgi:hypothetical protein